MQPKFGPIERQSMAQRVYMVVRDSLIDGRLSPGEKISLRTLARRLGTSAMPVREAINRLSAEQALQMLPNRQVIVPFMSRRKFLELCEIRRMLEGMAGEAAARNLTAAEIAQLEEVHALAMDARDDTDASLLLARNKDFHFRLYRASGSEVLLPMIEGLWMQIGPFMRLSFSIKKTRWNGAQHVALLDALRRQDVPAVRDAVHRDIGDMAENILEIDAFDEHPSELGLCGGKAILPGSS